MQEVPVLRALLRFVRFGLPWDFRRTITIARGGGPHALSFPAQAGDPVRRGPSIQPLPSRRTGSPGRSRAMTARMERRRTAPPAPPPSPASRESSQGSAITSRSDQQCLDKEMPAIPRPQGTRASANTSGPDSTLTARLLVKLQNRRTGPAPNEENLFLLPDREESDPTVDLMSRRHPLSSTRTSRRR